MVKHTQTGRRLLPKNRLIVFDHFEGLVLEGLRFKVPISSSSSFCFTNRIHVLPLVQDVDLIYDKNDVLYRLLN